MGAGADVGDGRGLGAGDQLGFFVGSLGRAHVAILYEEGVTVPSDIDGLVYIPYDHRGAWQLPLVRELNAAGIVVDANRLL